jgi:hypothetical protein
VRRMRRAPCTMISAAERQRRRYERRRDGRMCITIEIDRAVIDALRLPDWDDDNRGAIGAAIERLLAEWAKSHA